MIDHLEDARKRLKEEKELFGNLTVRGIRTENLLTDSDALLAVVKEDMNRAYQEWLDLAKVEKAEFFNAWLEHVYPKLAALPAHLRGETADV